MTAIISAEEEDVSPPGERLLTPSPLVAPTGQVGTSAFLSLMESSLIVSDNEDVGQGHD